MGQLAKGWHSLLVTLPVSLSVGIGTGQMLGKGLGSQCRAEFGRLSSGPFASFSRE